MADFCERWLDLLGLVNAFFFFFLGMCGECFLVTRKIVP